MNIDWKGTQFCTKKKTSDTEKKKFFWRKENNNFEIRCCGQTWYCLPALAEYTSVVPPLSSYHISNISTYLISICDVLDHTNHIFSVRKWSKQSVIEIISSYDEWWSSYHHKAEKTLHMLHFPKGYQIWYSSPPFLSYDDISNDGHHFHTSYLSQPSQPVVV